MVSGEWEQEERRAASLDRNLTVPQMDQNKVYSSETGKFWVKFWLLRVLAVDTGSLFPALLQIVH